MFSGSDEFAVGIFEVILGRKLGTTMLYREATLKTNVLLL